MRSRPLHLWFALVSVAAAPAGAGAQSSSESPLTLWYRQPAAEWVEALPVGNGRLGAMVFGGTTTEQIQLNEDTVWSGGGRTPPHVEGSIASQLPTIRRLLFDGKYAEGEALARKVMLTLGGGLPGASYQTLGDLRLTQELPGAAVAYRRSLDLDSGVAVTTFSAGGVTYRREVFASAPDQVIVVRLSADRAGAVSLKVDLSRPNASVEPIGSTALLLSNASADPGAPGVRFAAALTATAEGGTVGTEGNGLNIRGASAVTLLIAAATDYNLANPYAPLSRDYRAAALGGARAASASPYDRLRTRAVADHQSLFRRVELTLSAAPVPDIPTDERLAAVQAGGDDPHLVELYFQYGRYLLMGSSRPGGMPANLQGLWNKEMQAPWSSDYHININIQMNYWPAEVTNLSETALPFFDFIEALANVSGRRIARDFYGTRGFVGHYTTDAWLFTPAFGNPQYALWQMGGAWASRHFLEHYWFTGDRTFLARRAYPMLRDAATFLLDWLVPDPLTGKLVSGPSASPENRFIAPDGGKYSAAMGNAMDQEVAWDTFTNFLAAARELGIEDAVVHEVRAALPRLAWPQIGGDGRLMEWAHEFKEPEPGHRHMSQLFGLHPGYQFTQSRTPDYMAAARKTIETRLANGGGHTGWSRAWIVNFWARFHDGANAYENLQALLAKSTLKNLFDNHPPFQIDGNFGGTAGIAEMLLQSHDGDVTLLPALPKAWATGHFIGLRARGGFEVDAEWRDGLLQAVRVKSLLGNSCRLRLGDTVREFRTTRGGTYAFTGMNLDPARRQKPGARRATGSGSTGGRTLP